MIELDKIYNEDCLSTLARMDDNSIDCVVTSPPYYGLRKYSDSELEIGREETPSEYIDNLVKVFTEVYRVLKPTGTVWVNIGDTYNGNKVGNTNEKWSATNTDDFEKKKWSGCKNKDLIGVPWMFAFALRDRCGFYLRNDIIWYRPNAMPESVTDRLAKCYEHIFLFTKSEKYYFDYEAIQEKTSYNENRKYAIERESGYNTKQNRNPDAYLKDGKNLHKSGQTVQGLHANRANGGTDKQYEFKRKKDLWIVNTQPSQVEHCAMYPEKLIYPCILAGCPEGGIVYDPFIGSGTTALATIHCLGNRHYIGSELSAEYSAIAEKRANETNSQLTLF